MNNSLPLVTIITPAYNRAAFLVETIESVLTQSYPNIEYIILDDGSTDHTREILQKYNGRLIWETHPNMGETRTVNKGFSMARGEIICVVNSDDPLLPGAVSAAVKVLQKQPKALAAYPNWREIGPDSSFIQDHLLPEYTLHSMLTDFNVAMGPGTFFRRAVFDELGMRNPDLKYTGDLDFWFRLAIHGELAHIPQILATHRTHPDSASVSDRGSRMAHELIQLADNVLRHPKLPSDLRSQRPLILGYAHYVATYYCGKDWTSALRHRLYQIRFNHRSIILSTARRAFSLLRIFLGTIRSRASETFMRKKLDLIAFFANKSYQILFILWKVLCCAARILNRSSNWTKKRTKFAFLSHVIPPSWSGQAVVIRRILDGVDPRIYCLISSQGYSANRDFIGRLPATYHTLPTSTWIHRGITYPAIFKLNTMLGIFLRARHIAGILSKERCSALVAGTGDLIDLPAASLASLFMGVYFYPYLFDDYEFQWADSTCRSMTSRFAAMIYMHATDVIVPNEFLQKEIQRRHGRKAQIVRNCCESKWLNRTTSKPSEAGGKSVSIVYTGAVYHVNFAAFRNLIAAIESPGLESVKLHLYTAQPEEFLRNEKIFGSQVVLHQHVAPERVVETQHSADILFIPFSFNCSVPEIIKTSAPGKFGDYLASGTPILAHLPSDSFVSWYLRTYDCGLVADRDDPKALKDAILKLINDPAMTARLVENARRQALNDFSPEVSRRQFFSAVGVNP